MKHLENKAGGGFPAYIYPCWSSIAGWCIFLACLIPIPVVYIVNYVREYRSIGRNEIVCFSNIICFELNFILKTRSVGPESRDYLIDDDDFPIKPRYLEAFARTNLPRYDWGPMKSVNHYGLYRHLNDIESVNEIDFDLTRASVVARLDSRNFEAKIPEKNETEMYEENP
jgi:hypothetical protein